MATAVEARATLREGMVFEGEAGSGHRLLLDAAPEAGGQNQGFLPMELFLVGLAGCTGMDVISILRKMRQEVIAYQVVVRGERAEQHPRVYTDITVEHIVRGRNLNPEMVARAVELSETRYCPASAMLRQAAQVAHSYRLIEEAGEGAQGGVL